jgi:hypothetical protein
VEVAADCHEQLGKGLFLLRGGLKSVGEVAFIDGRNGG